MKVLDKNLFGGFSGKEALSRLKMLNLQEGEYICAGYNSLTELLKQTPQKGLAMRVHEALWVLAETSGNDRARKYA
ncbi:hypothetical protein PR001_g16990 [Phytophthora rubi]|uniref:Uncharacterized protein n=1 Tax=Phytophthora rubi TaxID=129364 RepID=A0A6A3KQ91_9STRA|nr:hypothetical protein PR001_g16990 [Phytophthora rubi]